MKRTETLFADYYRDVYSYLYSLTRDASLAEDLTSEVFLEVVRCAASFRGESDVKTWLFSIARHRWYHWLRKKHRSPETELLTEFLPSALQSPEERMLDSILVSRIHALLKQEPERPREIVYLRLSGYSFYEIGQRYGISEASARVIDFRAKAKLRRTLEQEGFDCD